MRINTNSWNRIRYTVYTPFYDLIANYFRASRKRSVELLDVKQNDNVLIVGAGTGLDLEFLPAHCNIVATDITPSMVQRIKERSQQTNLNVQALVMDGQALNYAGNSFDKIILHLILAVIPDPVKCLQECERVLKPGGRIVVFDKFVAGKAKVSILRRFINVFTNILATDVTRNFEALLSETHLTKLADHPADLNGTFRIICLRK